MIQEATPQKDFLIEDHTMLFDEGVIDSFMIIQLLGVMEEVFKIQLAPEDLSTENFETLEKMALLVQKYVSD